MANPASEIPASERSILRGGSDAGASGREGRGPHSAGAEPVSGLGSIRLTPAERLFLDRALTDMTQRERDVVYALCAGGTNEEMARRLNIALPTLRTHLMRLNQKLRTSSKSDVIRHIASVLLEGYRTSQIRCDQL